MRKFKKLDPLEVGWCIGVIVGVILFIIYLNC
jgi:hypothetical protein